MADEIQNLINAITNADLWEEEYVLKRNAFLVRAGTVSTKLFIVDEGSLRVIFQDESEEHTIRFAYNNAIFGALDSFISEQPTVYSIQALKKAKLRSINKHTFLELIHSTSQLRICWENTLIALIQQQLEREVDLLTATPQARYKRLLDRSPAVFQAIPHKYIASYLRMTPETLSRIKKS